VGWDLHLAFLLRGSGVRRRTGSRLWRWGTRPSGCSGPPDLLLVLLDLLLNKNELSEQTLLGYVIVRERKEEQKKKKKNNNGPLGRSAMQANAASQHRRPGLGNWHWCYSRGKVILTRFTFERTKIFLFGNLAIIISATQQSQYLLNTNFARLKAEEATNTTTRAS